jgi:intracellular septation protein
MGEISIYKIIFTRETLRNLVFEFGPIVLFALSFHFAGPYKATFLLMVSTLVSTIVVYRLEKRIPYITLYITLLTILFGYITLHKHNIHFLQLRDTVYDFTLAGTLFIGLLFNVLFLKISLSHYLVLSDKAWKAFTLLWITFFMIGGTANEFIRTHASVGGWLTYKMIMIAVTIIFTVVSIHIALSEDRKNGVKV